MPRIAAEMTPPSAEEVKRGHSRLAYQEALGLISLPDKATSNGDVIKRYMSRRSAWTPGLDFVPLVLELGGTYTAAPNTYGGHVYSQAGLAASLSLRAARITANNGGQDKKLGIHTIHGFFSEAGRSDRPFIYEVSNLASNASFPNLQVTVRQPISPSTHTDGDHYPKADADLPLGPVCFSAMISFRPSTTSRVEAQEPSPQARFSEILTSRRPMEWDPVPIADIDYILAKIPGARHAVGTFPGFEMRKVDMHAYNTSRPLHERREIMLHRLLAPLPATVNDSPDKDGACAIDGPDAHICAHAYVCDRNGLLMIGNHIAELGNEVEIASVASLSYSFVVHVNAEDAVMKYDEGQEWWVQEACFPRVQAGRGIIHSKIWSPRGVHVATMYQDGIIRWKPKGGGDENKGKPREGGRL
ncbi:thioesterase-like superfamily-domain-containing protein [Xylaria bambusicola]|uniref:thioesterase-like superfamily-domain-containing protein n=1 Tax=Xylaria bambusicola TaxID=326684 RepID=UPI002007ADF0|nr:thioesterase-like superfamily-domain-containing protein [Xylaria bambusicola]KAI0508672.1 thioesterase-like superfamily-domain-containing protein [Xylaria bambusicola]